MSDAQAAALIAGSIALLPGSTTLPAQATIDHENRNNSNNRLDTASIQNWINDTVRRHLGGM